MDVKEVILNINNHISDREPTTYGGADQEITGNITLRPEEEVTIPIEVAKMELIFPRSNRRLWCAVSIILCSQIGFAIFFLYTILFG